MNARGRSLFTAGLVMLVIGLVAGAVALALEATSTTDEGGVGANATTTATSAPIPGGDDPVDGADPTDSTAPSIDGGGSTTGTSDGPVDTMAPGATATTSVMTPPTASADELAARLAEAAAEAGFPILGIPDPEWELVTVDSGTSMQGRYVATTYERGSDYLTTSQERSATFPEVPNTVQVTVRGRPGDLLDMGHVVVIRWAEDENSVVLSTSLPRDQALALAEALEPIR